jgi:DNA-binding transcriptional LysR family regulator
MELRQLNALVAIADHGSFSAAARALATVQSNVSAHIARLERELNATLIDRASGRLTEEGDIVVERARRILHELDDITADIASRDDQVAGDTRLGVMGTTARWLMPALLPSLGRAHPGVRPIVYEGSSSSLVPRLLAGHLDAAIVHLPVDASELTVEPLFAEELVLLAPGNHPLAEAGRSEMDLAELDGQPLLVPPRSTGLRRVLDRAATQAGIAIVPLAEIDGMRLMASLAFEGFGAAIVPATAIPGWLRGDFARITVNGLPRRAVGWVERRRPRPSRPTLATAAVARDVVQRRAAKQPGVHLGEAAFPLTRP